MRLLFVSHSFTPEGKDLANLGGMQRVAVELDSAMSRVVGPSYAHLVLRSTWRWVHWKVPFFLVRTGLTLRRLIRRGDVDLVLFSSMVTAALAVPLAYARGRDRVRLAAIVHGLDVTTPFPPYQRFLRRVFARLDLVLPVSRATGAACVERGLDPDRLRPVGNGVDVGRFPEPSHDPSRRRASLAESALAPAPDGGLLLVSVGRHVRRKGFEWFIRTVMPRLPDDVRYWLVGEGPETPALRVAIDECGLEDRVRLLGRRSEAELAALLGAADLFVMPNIPVPGDMEGFGVVILEAGLAGLPSVGARLEGVAEVISEGRNGHLVPPGDAGAFADAIRAYHGDPDRLAAASRSARSYTVEGFGWSAVASRTLDALGLSVIRVPSPDPRATG